MGMVKWAALAAVGAMLSASPASAFLYTASSATTDDSPLNVNVPVGATIYLQMTGDPAFLLPDPVYFYHHGYDYYSAADVWQYGNDGLVENDLTWSFDGTVYTASFSTIDQLTRTDFDDGSYRLDYRYGRRVSWDNYYQVRGGADWTFTVSDAPIPAPGAAPEPATWALMIAGLGLAGNALRRRQIGQELVRLV